MHRGSSLGQQRDAHLRRGFRRASVSAGESHGPSESETGGAMDTPVRVA